MLYAPSNWLIKWFLTFSLFPVLLLPKILGQAPDYPPNPNQTYNLIEVIPGLGWQVKYTYQDRIDTVVYLQEQGLGIIYSTSGDGVLLEMNWYRGEHLPPPAEELLLGKTPVSPNWKKAEPYVGQKISFPQKYLRKREFFHSNGMIKAREWYADIFATSELLSVDPIMGDTTRHLVQEWRHLPALDWHFFDRAGNLIRIEKYELGNLISQIRRREYP